MSSRLTRGTQPLERVSASLEATSEPRHHTCSHDRNIKCSGTSRAPGSKANPRHAGPLTQPGNQIPALFDQPALCSHPRRCAGAVRQGRCHSVTLCRLLPYLLHVAPLERGRRHPRKGYGHQFPARLGRRRDARPAGRVTSITSGPERPSPPLCRHPGHCWAISRTVRIQVDRTSPRPPLCSLRSSVSQALEPVYGRRTNEELQRYYPRSRSWTDTGVTTTPARSKIRQDGHRIAGTVRHAATPCLKPCGMTVNRLPLVYKRRRRSPGRRERTSLLTRIHPLAHSLDIGTSPQSSSRDLEAFPPLPPSL